MPIFAVAAIGCLLLPLLWGVAAFRARRGRAPGDVPLDSAVIQGAASLAAFPVAVGLPYAWAGVAALVVADLIAVGAVLMPLWSRRNVSARTYQRGSA